MESEEDSASSNSAFDYEIKRVASSSSSDLDFVSCYQSTPQQSDTSVHSPPALKPAMASNAIVREWLRPAEDTPAMSDDVAEEYRTLEEELMNISLSDDVVTDTASVFAYVGFNADIIRSALKAREPDLQVYGKEICTLITIVLSRGTSIATKSKEKMTPRGVEIFNNLCLKYKVKRVQFAKKHLANTDVTLSRVVAFHPELAYRILLCKNLQRPISLTAMKEAGYTDFAPGLWGSYVFSCFPTDKTNLLRKKSDPLPINECFMNSITYARATMQSMRFESARRADWFNKMTIQQATEAKEQLALLGFVVPE